MNFDRKNTYILYSFIKLTMLYLQKVRNGCMDTYLPLYNCLVRHSKKRSLSYHVPGHKNGQILPSHIQSSYADFLQYDLTEISGLDDLHQAESVIKEAQELTAKLYGVDESFFLVNGSTVGNLAAILSLCQEGDKIAVQRDSHKSIFNAIALSKASPIFLAPEIDSKTHLSTGVSIKTIKAALEHSEDIKAFVLTNPTYYGVARDLKEIIDFIHGYNIPIIIDEAHGAHFILGNPFPSSAVTYGADLVVQSAHKTLPAMTMGSYLHMQGTLVNKQAVRHYLQVLQSSSPSYPIMASLDLARYYLQQFTQHDIDRMTDNIHSFAEKINEIDTLSTIDVETDQTATDLLKMTLTCSAATGYHLQKELEKQNIYTELADVNYVLFVLPLSSSWDFNDTIKRVRQAVENIQRKSYEKPLIKPFRFSRATVLLSMEERKLRSKHMCSFEEAIGCVSAQSVIPYPPGIPILMEGETITSNHIDYILHIQRLNGHIQGGSCMEKGKIEVFK